MLKLDELLRFDPEPCVDCAMGLAYITCWGVDGHRRCRLCVRALAERLGWDEEVLRPADKATPPPPTKLPFE